MNRVADLAIGGWQVNAIEQAHTGFPITAQAAGDVSGTTSGFERANCNGAPVTTPYRRSNINGVPGYLWLDPSSVSNPTSGFGNCQVGSFTGPGLQAFDAAVTKDFHITEVQRLQFRAEAINALNHPILVAPNSTVGTNFGLINNAQGERNLQFALKYHF